MSSNILPRNLKTGIITESYISNIKPSFDKDALMMLVRHQFAFLNSYETMDEHIIRLVDCLRKNNNEGFKDFFSNRHYPVLAKPEEFKDYCDQHANAIGMILGSYFRFYNKASEYALARLDCCEIEFQEYIKGSIKPAKPNTGSTYDQEGFDYIPHSILSIKIGNKSLLADPKYLMLRRNEVISPIKSCHHCDLETGIMSVSHQDDKRKSRVFLPLAELDDESARCYDFKNFPILVKDKGGIRLYKAFQNELF